MLPKIKAEGAESSTAGASPASVGKGGGMCDKDEEICGSEIEARRQWLVAGGNTAGYPFGN